MQLIEQLESRTLFSASVVLGDVTEVNMAVANVKAMFKSVKSYNVNTALLTISNALGYSLRAKEITSKQYFAGVLLVSDLNDELRTKYADLAATGKTLINTVETGITNVVADVKRVAAKPQSASLRKQLNADINPMEILTTKTQQLEIHYSLSRIRNATDNALNQVAALDSKDKNIQSDISTTESEISNGMGGLRLDIDDYFTAVNKFVSDARAFA